MANTTTYNLLLERMGGDKIMNEMFTVDLQTALSGVTTLGASTNQISKHTFPSNIRALPALSGDTTAYWFTYFDVRQTGSNCKIIFGRFINMGNLNIGTNVFTDGAAMPTVTSLGASYQIPSALLAVTTTALNATPGNIDITYVDQDNNTAEAVATHSLTASSSKYACSWVILNSPDWGVLDVTAATQSGGTTPSGVVTFYGIIPIGVAMATATVSLPANMTTDFPNFFKFGANDDIQGVLFNTSSAKGIMGKITYVGII